MTLTTKNDLIWGWENDEYPTLLYKECGYTVTERSWYDGPLIQLEHDYYKYILSYAACARTYSFSNNDKIFINVEEHAKLTKRVKVLNPGVIELYKVTDGGDELDFTKKLNSLSPEFIRMVHSLTQWVADFNKESEDYIYTIEIYAEKGTNINDL